jgi:hypothetical protein
MFIAAHVPLALAMNRWAEVSTLHAVLTILGGLWWTGAGQDPLRVAYVGAYIAGAEVLWRVTDARVLWEFGKYSTCAFFLLASVRGYGRGRWLIPATYVLLLIPSAYLTVAALGDWRVARGPLSFNLSGPFALAVCAWFFSQRHFEQVDIRRILLALVSPAVGMAALTVFNILTDPTLRFTSDSNMAVTGGFGPNQVSATLGLGALAALFIVLDQGLGKTIRGLALVCVLFLVTQSALTFSRGGLYNALAGFIAAFVFLSAERRARARVIMLTLALIVAGRFVIAPALDDFTGGTMIARFHDLNPSGRNELVEADLQIWRAHPLLGIGPGLAAPVRESMVSGSGGAHTEFTRLLAEHGLFGLLAAVLLLATAVCNIITTRGLSQKALVASFVVWGIAFMLHAAMRLGAPAFALGFGFATLRRAQAPSPGRAPLRTLRPVRAHRALMPRPRPVVRP